MRGFSWYDSLQTKVTKRFSQGLQGTVSFTWQKELEYGSSVNDVYNPSLNKSLSSSSQPFMISIGFTYMTPAVGPNRFVRTIARDWT